MRKTIWFAFVIAASCQNSSESKKADEDSTAAGQARRLVGGKHIRAAGENRTLKIQAETLEKRARDSGWNIRKNIFLGDQDYVNFLVRLLADGRVVETGKVHVGVDVGFIVVDDNVYVDHRASIDEVIKFLTE